MNFVAYSILTMLMVNDLFHFFIFRLIVMFDLYFFVARLTSSFLTSLCLSGDPNRDAFASARPLAGHRLIQDGRTEGAVDAFISWAFSSCRARARYARRSREEAINDRRSR